MRVDKYIWTVRLFRTRTIATKECKNQNVWVNNQKVKPSREVKVGDRIKVKKNHIFLEYEIIALPKSRLGAKLVPDYAVNHTKQEEYDKLKVLRYQYAPQRDKGEGRPTKKDRRDLDNLYQNEDADFDWDEFIEGIES